MSIPEELPSEIAVEEAKTLSSVVRLRILRLCLHEPQTNKELARMLDINPATCLHHVRRLVDHGFLEALEPQRGARGAREIPYRATRKSLRTPLLPGQQRVLVQAFLDEFALTDPSRSSLTRIGVRLSQEDREEMVRELNGVLEKYAEREPDPDSEPWSVFLAVHPEHGPTT